MANSTRVYIYKRRLKVITTVRPRRSLVKVVSEPSGYNRYPKYKMLVPLNSLLVSYGVRAPRYRRIDLYRGSTVPLYNYNDTLILLYTITRA